MITDAALRKIARLRAGGRPRVLDLFAGCGGLSLGFKAAGFAIQAAVESDPHAARSHARNFHGGDAEHSRARDIVTTPPEALGAALNLGPVADAIDVIVGGPPCQAFARVGRPKLREIAAHPPERAPAAGAQLQRAARCGPAFPPAVTAEQALADLPPIHARQLLAAGKLKRGVRRFDCPVPYDRRRRPTDWGHFNLSGQKSQSGETPRIPEPVVTMASRARAAGAPD